MKQRKGEGSRMDDYLEARSIFRVFGGSHFMMEKENRYQHYKTFQVPRELEIQWRYEMIEEGFKALESEPYTQITFSNICAMYREMRDGSQLTRLLAYVENSLRKHTAFVSFHMMKCFHNLLKDFLDRKVITQEVVSKYKDEVIDILESLLNQLNETKPDIKISDLRNLGEKEDVIPLMENEITTWKKL